MISTNTFAKVGAVNAIEKTESNCIISADGLGMVSSWVGSLVNSTLPQVAHAIPSLHKNGQSPETYYVIASRKACNDALWIVPLRRIPSDIFFYMYTPVFLRMCAVV